MAADAPPVLWEPSPERVARATLSRFLREQGVASYAEGWQRSIEDVEGFWRAICAFFDVRFETEAERVLSSNELPGARWFEGATLSFAEHVFRDRDPGAVAIQHASELRGLEALSWGELRDQTARIAAALRREGVGPGDRVVGYLPNVPQAMAAFYACASIGAVWSSCSPDFGERSVTDRFAQIEPVVLLAVDGYRYAGKDHDRRGVVAALQAAMPTLRTTVLVEHLGCGGLEGTVAWEGWLRSDEPAPALAFTPLPFEHPLWVLYSSGTTGLPKAIVHGQGGILLEHLKQMGLMVDAQPDDRVLWFTTTGWMMWNFLCGVLLTGASVVLYDGSPGHPDLGTLWDLAEEAGVTVFGTSAAYLGSCAKAGVRPAEGRDLSALHAVGSTGSPLSPEGFEWVYEHVGRDTWLFSTSGGTDVCTAFVGGVPTLPVHRGELQARALGAAIEAWDEEGRSVIGEVGELVITEPMPSMPLELWDDPAGVRLRASYFDHFPGVWRHGDWIEITDRGTAVIHGRSDSTINRGGIRMGTAEIYRAVLAEDDVVDALVVDVAGREGHPDGWMPLFVVLRDGAAVDDDLRRRLARRIRTECSPRHVPDEVRAVAQVPRTLSGKVLEVPVKRILMGADPDKVAARDSLQDPAALEPFVALAAELRAE